MVSFMFFLGGLGCLGGASQKTETKTSGHLWWKKETTVAIATETRLAWLAAGVLLMLVALALALILYRSSRGSRAIEGGEPSSATSSVVDRSPDGTFGYSKEFWVQTIIAILGLVITAVSAAAAWWR